MASSVLVRICGPLRHGRSSPNHGLPAPVPPGRAGTGHRAGHACGHRAFGASRSPTSTPATTQLVATTGSRRGRWRRGRRVGAHTGGIANSGPRGDLVGVVGHAPASSRRASSLRPWPSPPPAQPLPGPVGAPVVQRPPGRRRQPQRHVPRRRDTDRELTRAPSLASTTAEHDPHEPMRGWWVEWRPAGLLSRAVLVPSSGLPPARMAA